MKRFVFRAQAALDLRKKQEDEARRALAKAEADEREARTAVDEARAQLDSMLQQGIDNDEAGDLASSIWHRNWIVGQRQRIKRGEEIWSERQEAVKEAADRAQLARRRAKSLERFREHAWRRFVREEARQEQKILDELGAIRFVIERSDGGQHR